MERKQFGKILPELPPRITTAEYIQGVSQTLARIQKSLRLPELEDSYVDAAREVIGSDPINLRVLPQGSSCAEPQDLFEKGTEVGPVICSGFSRGEAGKWEANFAIEGHIPFSVPVELVKVIDPVQEG